MSAPAGPEVSVVVAAFNAADTLPELLAALRRQTMAADRFEVLVVDDCSTDATPELVNADPLALLLRTERRGGPAAARNVALRAAAGEVLAIVDADCVPAPAWLEAGLEDLVAGTADLLGGHVDVPLAQRPSVAELVDFARYMDQRRTIDDGGFAITANLFVRRRVVETIGLFNERLITNEDREFCVRARQAGFGLAYSRAAAVRHDPRTRARDLARKCFRYGVGEELVRAHAAPPVCDVQRIWTSPGAYLLRRGVYGMERLHEHGRPPSRRQVIGMHLGEYVLVQLPMIAGSLVGTLQLAGRR